MIYIVLLIPVGFWSTNALSQATIVKKTDILGVHSTDSHQQNKKTKLSYQLRQQKRLRAPQVTATKPTTNIAARNNSGNLYPKGQCTWYAKSKRPDLPNHLGNANQWPARARLYGISTGSTPQKNAIGQKGMHVVYVELVNPDGTMNISEYNYLAPRTYSQRTVSSSGYQFIY